MERRFVCIVKHLLTRILIPKEVVDEVGFTSTLDFFEYSRAAEDFAWWLISYNLQSAETLKVVITWYPSKLKLE